MDLDDAVVGTGAASVGPSDERAQVPRAGHSLATRRRRAVGWSVLCSVAGVPLMAYLALGLAKVTTPANEAPGPWWIWFSLGTAVVAGIMVVSVFVGRWTLARNLALVLMVPGLVMFVLLCWAFFLGFAFLPGALVWVPVLLVCLAVPGHERAAAVGAPSV